MFQGPRFPPVLSGGSDHISWTNIETGANRREENFNSVKLEKRQRKVKRRIEERSEEIRKENKKKRKEEQKNRTRREEKKYKTREEKEKNQHFWGKVT